MFKMDVAPNISLALLELSASDEYLELVDRNREYLTQWLPWPNNIRKHEDAAAFIERTRKQWYENEGFTAGILYAGKLCGIAGFNSMRRRQRHIALGYWLDQNMQGKGIMTQVCSFLVNYAFSVLAMNRIEIRTEVNNQKSRAIPERLGFVYEGNARQSNYVNGKFVDHAVYSLLAKEWNTASRVIWERQGDKS